MTTFKIKLAGVNYIDAIELMDSLKDSGVIPASVYIGQTKLQFLTVYY
jgi:hypothetical protein